MAYRRRSTSRRASVSRRTSSRSSYRSRAVRSGSRRSRASGGRGQTIRIELVSPSGVARPEIGMKPAEGPHKRMF